MDQNDQPLRELDWEHPWILSSELAHQDLDLRHEPSALTVGVYVLIGGYLETPIDI